MARVNRARRILDRFKEMKAEKQNWLPLFQLCAEYVHHRKQGFTTNITQGQPQTDQVFDDTAANANALMAASLIGALWPNGAKTFRISIPFGMEEELGEETEEVKDYYQFVTKQMATFMDNPKSGFVTALEEYMLDQGSFGTSGIKIEDQEDDFEVPLAYRAVDAKMLYIDEGANGFVDTIYLENEYSVRQLVEKYGYENVSSKWQKAFDNNDCKTKIKVLQAIEPRFERDAAGFGVQDMPYASIHIDEETEKILKESGFLELPVAVTRFYKAMGEKYGRSPAMNALPSILEANSLGQAWLIAVEKMLDPPLAVYDDGTMGGGTIDTSARGLNVINVNGRISTGHKPIEPLWLVGDLRWTAERRTELAEVIKNHFFQDRLLDLNNEQRMTLGEANIRNGLRGQTLNPVYSRQMAELFVPIIDTTFAKLRRRGFLGVIPDSTQEQEFLARGIIPRYIPEAVVRRMVSGQEVYRIEFISPATRIMQAEEVDGTNMLLQTAIELSGVKPESLDVIDVDWALRRIQELGGAAREAINSSETIRKIRQQRQQLAEAQMQLEAARSGSETARNVGQAVSSMSGGQAA